MLEDVNNFIEGRWQIDCPFVTVTEIDTGKVVFTGAGSIRQLPDGVVELKAYLKDQKLGLDYFSKFPKIGKLTGYQYQIVALPYQGEEWSAKAYWLSPISGLNGTILTAKLDNISKITNYSTKNSSESLSIILSEIAEFPSSLRSEQKILKNGVYYHENTLNEVKIKIGGVDIRMIRDGSIVRVECYKQNGKILSSLQWKIWESLQFLLGKKLNILVIEKRLEDKEIIELCPMRRNNNEKLLPPIVLSDVAHHKWYWELFALYFQKTLEESSDQLHPLSRYLNSLLDSSQASLEGQCLSLAVAIEGLVNYFFEDLKPEKNFTKSKILEIHKKVEEIELSDIQRNRLTSLIEMLNQIRAKDKLYDLVKSNKIDAKLVNSWSDMRNRAAHGTLVADDHDIEKYFGFRNSMLTLFYKLIFLIIGYEGKYTDYSIDGYPTIDLKN